MVVAEQRFGVRRQSRSGRGFDALTPQDERVEIKLTQSDKAVAFSSHKADHVLVFRLHRDGEVKTVYNGPPDPIYAELGKFKENQRQRQIIEFRNDQIEALLQRLGRKRILLTDEQRRVLAVKGRRSAVKHFAN